jgi:DNA-directed RNA polymerase III subunit RPC2
MVVMKAVGMESDQEVVQMVGRDPRYSVLLLPSIEVSIMIKNLKSVMNIFFFFGKLKIFSKKLK